MSHDVSLISISRDYAEKVIAQFDLRDSKIGRSCTNKEQMTSEHSPLETLAHYKHRHGKNFSGSVHRNGKGLLWICKVRRYHYYLQTTRPQSAGRCKRPSAAIRLPAPAARRVQARARAQSRQCCGGGRASEGPSALHTLWCSGRRAASSGPDAETAASLRLFASSRRRVTGAPRGAGSPEAHAGRGASHPRPASVPLAAELPRTPRRRQGGRPT